MRVSARAVLACLAASGAAAQGGGTPLLREGQWDLKRSDDGAGLACGAPE